MIVSIKVTPKKKRGRPATGRDPHVTARMPTELILEVEMWAIVNKSSRSEAIRRLVEIGLEAGKPTGRLSSKTAARSAELAAKVIEHHVKDASPEEREARKRRVLKGPSPFRGMRKDK